MNMMCETKLYILETNDSESSSYFKLYSQIHLFPRFYFGQEIHTLFKDMYVIKVRYLIDKPLLILKIKEYHL